MPSIGRGASTRRLAVPLVALCACYSPHYIPGLLCSPKGECPPDQTCGPNNRCEVSLTVDASITPDADIGICLGQGGFAACFPDTTTDVALPAKLSTNRPWEVAMPSPRPSGRTGPAMAYDAAHGEVVLFGGNDNNGTILGDTWVWDGTTWTSKASGVPPARWEHAMAYDEARGKVVLFGGYGNSGQLADTWEWNGISWTNVTPASGNPPARVGHTMAYDVTQAKVIMFGGAGNSGSSYMNDTWAWNGSAWTNVTPASGNPPGRFLHAMATDVFRVKVVLWGGDAGGLRFNDTWEWNGSAWTNMTPASGSPPARAGIAMTFDAARAKIVLYGDDPYGTSALSDTWEWNGAAWADVTPASGGPGPRTGSAMAFLATRDEVVMLGGYPPNSSTSLSRDIWTWHGSDGLCSPNPPLAHPDTCFIVAHDIRVDATTVTGSRPLELFATGSITVAGRLDVASHRFGATGPAANATQCSAFVSAPTDAASGGGGAGGSFRSMGGNGGTGASGGAARGFAASPVGAPDSLRGGCGGQPGAHAGSGVPGAGGGAIFLAAANTITIEAGSTIDASGAGGAGGGKSAGGSGGGSGGMIKLYATALDVVGAILMANGGGGGGGGDATIGGAHGGDPSAATVRASGGMGIGVGGGDGGYGFAAGQPATAGVDDADGGGGGGGGGGYVEANLPLTGATVSAGP